MCGCFFCFYGNAEAIAAAAAVPRCRCYAYTYVCIRTTSNLPAALEVMGVLQWWGSPVCLRMRIRLDTAVFVGVLLASCGLFLGGSTAGLDPTFAAPPQLLFRAFTNSCAIPLLACDADSTLRCVPGVIASAGMPNGLMLSGEPSIDAVTSCAARVAGASLLPSRIVLNQGGSSLDVSHRTLVGRQLGPVLNRTYAVGCVHDEPGFAQLRPLLARPEAELTAFVRRDRWGHCWSPICFRAVFDRFCSDAESAALFRHFRGALGDSSKALGRGWLSYIGYNERDSRQWCDRYPSAHCANDTALVRDLVGRMGTYRLLIYIQISVQLSLVLVIKAGSINTALVCAQRPAACEGVIAASQRRVSDGVSETLRKHCSLPYDSAFVPRHPTFHCQI